VQLVMGALNIALGAPAWLQLGHLLGAQLAWLSVVLLGRAWYLPGPLPGKARALAAPVSG
jgi:heme A synthase